MELVTALSLVGTRARFAETAWNVGETLCAFAHGTRHINETVNDLATEVKQLGNPCGLVEEQLKELVPLCDKKSKR